MGWFISVFVVIMPVLPLAALLLAVRHGPFPSRWWRGENMLGFAAVIGGFAFAAGFFGPLIFTPQANQGPLLGIFITGPAGFVAGLLWGAVRAMRRRARTAAPPAPESP
jgi:hypothetical protein